MASMFKYVSVGENGEVEDKTVVGFMYAVDLCLCASSEDGLQRVMDEIASCIAEDGMKLSRRKFKVVCINGEKTVNGGVVKLKSERYTGE